MQIWKVQKYLSKKCSYEKWKWNPIESASVTRSSKKCKYEKWNPIESANVMKQKTRQPLPPPTVVVLRSNYMVFCSEKFGHCQKHIYRQKLSLLSEIILEEREREGNKKFRK